MGCEFNFEVLKATTPVDAVNEGLALIEQAAYDYGHAGYSGSFAEAWGVEFRSEEFDNEAEAEAWLDVNAKKWGPALIVKVTNGPYFIGANCSS